MVIHSNQISPVTAFGSEKGGSGRHGLLYRALFHKASVEADLLASQDWRKGRRSAHMNQTDSNCLFSTAG